MVKKATKAKWLPLTLLLGILIFVSGCSSNSTGSTGSTDSAATPVGTQTASSHPTVGLAIGNQAPDFSITMNDGKTMKLSELRGKPIFLNFWASWCPPCKKEMPDIQKISLEKHPVQIIAVNVKETPMEIRSFLSASGYSFPVGFDPNGEISMLYMATGIPTSYGIDRNGIIRYQIQGALTYAQLQQWFTTLEKM